MKNKGWLQKWEAIFEGQNRFFDASKI